MKPEPRGSSAEIGDDPQRLNLYSYVRNDPINFLDPDGLDLIYAPSSCQWDPAEERYACDGVYFETDPGGQRPGKPTGPGGGGPVMTVQQAHENCKENNPDANLTAEKANAIALISKFVGIDPTLLAVTWKAESQYEWNPVSNMNRNGKGIDAGPGQLNTRWITEAIEMGELTLDPYTWTQVFGTDFGDTIAFTGDPIANLTLAARFLKTKGEGAAAAGRYTGGPNYRARVAQYNDWSPALTKYFDCFSKQFPK